jgi:hypothetical protein
MNKQKTHNIDFNNFLELMRDLILSNSPKIHLDAIVKFFQLEPNFLSSEARFSIISKFQHAKEEKSKKSINNATKRRKNER